MKLKTMDIQKFLLTGWYPKMAGNVQSIADGGTTENQIINHKQNLIL